MKSLPNRRRPSHQPLHERRNRAIIVFLTLCTKHRKPQLRSGDSYTEKWQYVRHNPVRHELVASADQWPYQGELETLWWHD